MNGRILIIDDDAELRANLAEILGKKDFETVQAGCASEALTMLSSFEPDLVITDYMMPGMNGMELISEIKKTSPAVKIIMITAFAAIGNAVEAMKRGADDYIPKPFKKDELIFAVRKNIEESRFAKCIIKMNMDDALSCISNSIRRQILFMCYEERKIRFMDITRKLEIEDHTKVNFHLKVLKQNGMILQNKDKEYMLSEGGLNVIECLKMMSAKVQL